MKLSFIFAVIVSVYPKSLSPGISSKHTLNVLYGMFNKVPKTSLKDRALDASCT